MTKRRPGSRTDTERLDWITKNRIEIRPQFHNKGWELVGEIAYHNANNPSLRRHIDAAIKASQRTRKTGKVGA